jgi:hypothetical protein
VWRASGPPTSPYCDQKQIWLKRPHRNTQYSLRKKQNRDDIPKKIRENKLKTNSITFSLPPSIMQQYQYRFWWH